METIMDEYSWEGWNIGSETSTSEQDVLFGDLLEPYWKDHAGGINVALE